MLLCIFLFASYICVYAQGAIVPPSCEFAKECFSMSQKTGDEAEYEGDCSVDAYESCLNDWCAANSVACKQLSSRELTFMHLLENDFFADSLLYKVEFGLLDEFNSEEHVHHFVNVDTDKLASIFKENYSFFDSLSIDTEYDPYLHYKIEKQNKILYLDGSSDDMIYLNEEEYVEYLKLRHLIQEQIDYNINTQNRILYLDDPSYYGDVSISFYGENYENFQELYSKLIQDQEATYNIFNQSLNSEKFKDFMKHTVPFTDALDNNWDLSRFSNETKNDVMIAAMDFSDDKLDYMEILNEVNINPKESPLLTQDDFYKVHADIILNIESATDTAKDALGFPTESNKLFTKDQFLEILYKSHYIGSMSKAGIIDDAMSLDEWKNTEYWNKYEGILYTNEKKKTLSDYYEEYYSNHDFNGQKYEPETTKEKNVLEMIAYDFENYYDTYAKAAAFQYSLRGKSGLENLITQYDEFINKEYDRYLHVMDNYDYYFTENNSENNMTNNQFKKDILSFEEFENIAYSPDGFIGYTPNNGNETEKNGISKIEDLFVKNIEIKNQDDK